MSARKLMPQFALALVFHTEEYSRGSAHTRLLNAMYNQLHTIPGVRSSVQLDLPVSFSEMETPPVDANADDIGARNNYHSLINRRPLID